MLSSDLTWQSHVDDIVSNASATTRRTCYGSCADAELRLKFCVSCGWLGSESDSAATVPATHVSCGRRTSDAPNPTQKIPQRRHVHRTGAVPCGAFNVRSPYHRPRVRTAVCVFVPQWHGAGALKAPLTYVACTDISPLPRVIYSELITGKPEKIIFNLTKHGESTSVNMAWYPRRLGLLRLHLVAEGQRRNNLTMALVIWEIQRLQGERRVRQYWVRPWVERRRLFGQYHTLFQQLERESHGDYQAYIRMDTNTFAELLLRVSPYGSAEGPPRVVENHNLLSHPDDLRKEAYLIRMT